MRKATIAICFSVVFAMPGAWADTTIVLFRHAEKPEQGLGQLSCQGLNRALALPDVLAAKFGKADALFAPAPSIMVEDKGHSYSYVRPLATVEPTAIRQGLPVNTQWGYKDVDGLQNELLAPRHAGQMLYVAWEHKQLVRLARSLIRHSGGHPDQVPAWSGEDFDSLYVIRIDGNGTVYFKADHQGLNGQSSACPGEEPRRGASIGSNDRSY